MLFSSKLVLVAITWFLSAILSFGLRSFGFRYPDPLDINLLVVGLLLFGPSLSLGFWIVLGGLFKLDKEEPTLDKGSVL